MKVPEETLRQLESLKSPDGWLYAGLPKFKALFGRDSIISSLELLDFDPSIAVSTIGALIKLQGKDFNSTNMEEPGKIIHEYQTDKELIERRSRIVPWLSLGKNYFSVDSTPLFVILVSELWKKNRNMVKSEMIAAMSKAVRWIISHGMNGSFLSYRKPPPDSGLQSQSWRDGIGSILEQMKSPVSVIGVQGYAYLALNLAKGVLKNFGSDHREVLEEIDEPMNFIRNNLYDNFLTDDNSFLGLAIDGDGVLNRTVTSDPGHLLLSGVLNRKQQTDIVERLCEPDLMTDYGIRCLSLNDANFDSKAYQRGSIWPHDNWIIARGLRDNGFEKQYSDLRRRLLSASEEFHGLPEYFGVSRDGRLIEQDKMRIKACFPQAWSVGSQINLLKEKSN
ncbi:MAG: hypothetical protein M1431_06265 [Candidatus Thermoplasmatota archaeon]|nr:hypothetical protein [Candidatus Thermoplasmatota archaeon]